jgi:polysaccharide biosynthesis/export protein
VRPGAGRSLGGATLFKNSNLPEKYEMNCVSARWVLGVAAALVVCAGWAGAQTAHQLSQVSDSRGLHATRAELERVLGVYEQAAGTTNASSEEAIAARTEAALIRTRLEEGDFQVGDQVTIYVDGQTDLSNSYVVEPTRAIVIPGVGSVPLRGVLRSELEGYLTEYLGRYVRSPDVRAASTIRIMVLGGVGRPGFYSVPSHALVTDVIDAAGGTGHQSRLTGIRIERNGQRVVGGKQLVDAIIAGRTLDQLNVRAGDRVVVPEARSQRVREYMGWVGAIGGLAWTLVWLTGRR